MMLIFRMESLSRGVSELSLSEDKSGMRLLYQFSKMNGHDTKICSEHSLMTTHTCYNQNKTALVTLGEDGQLHLYLRDPSNKYIHTRSACLFAEPVTCVSWASNCIGGYVAVGSSKGGLAIVSVDTARGMLNVEWETSLRAVAASVDWSPNSCELLCGTTDGCVVWAECRQGFWRVVEEAKIAIEGRVSVACSQKGLWLAAVDHKVVELQKLDNSLQQKTIITLGQQIQKILIRSQYCIGTYPEVIMQTAKQLLFYRLMPGQPILAQSHQLTWPLLEICWGWSQSELVCYPCSSPQHRPHNSQALRLFRNVNGTWQ